MSVTHDMLTISFCELEKAMLLKSIPMTTFYFTYSAQNLHVGSDSDFHVLILQDRNYTEKMVVCKSLWHRYVTTTELISKTSNTFTLPIIFRYLSSCWSTQIDIYFDHNTVKFWRSHHILIILLDYTVIFTRSVLFTMTVRRLHKDIKTH